jgi:hypothetical protein
VAIKKEATSAEKQRPDSSTNETAGLRYKKSAQDYRAMHRVLFSESHYLRLDSTLKANTI